MTSSLKHYSPALGLRNARDPTVALGTTIAERYDHLAQLGTAAGRRLTPCGEAAALLALPAR
jgi:hypothetical protein